MTADLEEMVEKSEYEDLGEFLGDLESESSGPFEEAAEAFRELQYRRSEVRELMEVLLGILSGDDAESRAETALRTLQSRRNQEGMGIEGADLQDLRDQSEAPSVSGEDPKPSVFEVANEPMGG